MAFVFFFLNGGWIGLKGGFTYTGKEVLLVRISPVVDTALKFRGQCDFGLEMCGSTRYRAASDGWWKNSGGSELGSLVRSKIKSQIL